MLARFSMSTPAKSLKSSKGRRSTVTPQTVQDKTAVVEKVNEKTNKPNSLSRKKILTVFLIKKFVFQNFCIITTVSTLGMSTVISAQKFRN